MKSSRGERNKADRPTAELNERSFNNATSLLYADSARLVADSARLVADSGRLAANSGRLVANSARLAADSGRLVTETPVAFLFCVVQRTEDAQCVVSNACPHGRNWELPRLSCIARALMVANTKPRHAIGILFDGNAGWRGILFGGKSLFDR